MMRIGLAIMLTLLSAAPLAAQGPTPIDLATAGEIGPADPVDRQGRRFDSYPIHMQLGQRARFSVAPAGGGSGRFGLEFYWAHSPDSPLGGTRTDVGTGQPFTAQIEALYNVRVVALDGSGGSYLLRIEPLPPDESSTSATEPGDPGSASGPREGFIICPGHRRCRQ